MLNKKYISIGLCLLLFSGCSSKRLLDNQNEFTSEQIDLINSNDANNSVSKLKSLEINNKVKYIDLSISKNLGDILDEYSKLHGGVFRIDGDDLLVPATNSSDILNITSLKDLKNYVEDNTDYTFKIIKNKYLSNRTKVVKIINKKAMQTDIMNISFSVDSKQSVSIVLKELSKKIGFSIVFDKDLSDSNSNNIGNNSYFNDKYVYFTGDNVANFLKYIERNFDVYTTIDYQQKMIIINRYKTRTFNISALESSIDILDGGDDSTSTTTTSSLDGDASATQAAIESNVKGETKLNAFSQLEENLKEIIGGNTKQKIVFNGSSGQVTVRTTPSNMSEIEDIINKFNKIYTTQLKITVDIFEFVVSKDFSFGTDISTSRKNFTSSTNKLSSVIATLTEKSGETDIITQFNSKNSSIRYAKNYTYSQQYTSNIPKSINISNNRGYVKSVDTTTTSNTTTTTSSEMEIGNLNEGTMITVLPRVNGNKILLKSEVKINSTNDLKPETDASGNTIYMPDQDNKIIPSHIIINNGDKKLVGSYQEYQDVKNYNGVAPIEDFIIGGESGKKFIKKEIIIMITTEILD